MQKYQKKSITEADFLSYVIIVYLCKKVLPLVLVPKHIRFLIILFLTFLHTKTIFAQTPEKKVLPLVQLFPFMHGFLFIGFGYTLLFYFLARNRNWLYACIVIGTLSLSLRFYTNFTAFSIIVHVLLLAVVVVSAWRFTRLIQPLQLAKAQNQELQGQIEQQLNEIAHERANLYAVMESTHDLIYSLDKNLKFITMNTATRDIFYFFYERKIELGDDYEEMVAPAVFKIMKPCFDRAFQGEMLTEKVSYEFNGKTYYRQLYINPIRGKDQQIFGISVFSRDITASEIANQNLSYSESLLESTFEQSPDALFLVDETTFQITRCNKRALEMYEIDDSQNLLGKTEAAFHKYPMSEEENRKIIKNLQEKGIWTDEYEYKTIKGNFFWGILKISSLLLGNARAFLLRVSDITERKQNEMQILSKEANLRAILESNDQSIWLADENFVLIDYNQVYGEMLERTFGLKVKPHMDLIKHLPYIYKTMWQKRYKRVLKGQREEYIDAYEFNGIEYIYQITGFPVYEEAKGMPTRCSFFARDITAQVMAERELRANQMLIASINQHLKDALFRSTPAGRLLYANFGFLKVFGFEDEKEAYKQDMREFYENAQTRLKLQKFLEENHHYENQECVMVRQDGTKFWASISATQNYDEYGQVYYDGIIRDITEARRAKNQLKKQNKKLKKVNSELDKFVYSASHDLRAPLSSLLGLLDLFQLLDSEDEKKNILAMMLKSVRKLDEFINQIIQYSRNSRIEVKPELIDFADLLESVSDALKYMPNSEKILHILDMEIEAPFYSDYFRLSVILNNLVSNAIRYANLEAEKPYVKVLIHANEEKAVIEVSDNGQGIEEAYLPHIFRMFYRASEQNTGSGIGLYILKETLDVLKGKINVTSKVGEGTTFIVEIPNSLGTA